MYMCIPYVIWVLKQHSLLNIFKNLQTFVNYIQAQTNQHIQSLYYQSCDED